MKKAFTLIELIAVTVILGAIVLLAAPKAIDLLRSSKEESLRSLAEVIVGNAKIYVNTNDNFNPPATAGECKIITFSTLGVETQKTAFGDTINMSNSYVVFDNELNYYITITTEVGKRGLKNLSNTMLENDNLAIITFESDDTNNLAIPNVSNFSTTSGSETVLQLDTTGSGTMDSTCKLVEIRN